MKPLKGAWKDHWDCHIEPDWLFTRTVCERPFKT